MGGTTSYLGDLIALETVYKGRFTVHCGRTVTLLSMVIVTPCIHLITEKVLSLQNGRL